MGRNLDLNEGGAAGLGDGVKRRHFQPSLYLREGVGAVRVLRSEHLDVNRTEVLKSQLFENTHAPGKHTDILVLTNNTT